MVVRSEGYASGDAARARRPSRRERDRWHRAGDSGACRARPTHSPQARVARGPADGAPRREAGRLSLRTVCVCAPAPRSGLVEGSHVRDCPSSRAGLAHEHARIDQPVRECALGGDEPALGTSANPRHPARRGRRRATGRADHLGGRRRPVSNRVRQRRARMRDAGADGAFAPQRLRRRRRAGCLRHVHRVAGARARRGAVARFVAVGVRQPVHCRRRDERQLSRFRPCLRHVGLRARAGPIAPRRVGDHDRDDLPASGTVGRCVERRRLASPPGAGAIARRPVTTLRFCALDAHRGARRGVLRGCRVEAP